MPRWSTCRTDYHAEHTTRDMSSCTRVHSARCAVTRCAWRVRASSVYLLLLLFGIDTSVMLRYTYCSRSRVRRRCVRHSGPASDMATLSSACYVRQQPGQPLKTLNVTNTILRTDKAHSSYRPQCTGMER